MAEFNSRYERLTFYVDGLAKQFYGGRYATEDAAEIEELSKLTDVTRVDVPEETAKPRKAGASASVK
jgi:hypothetical protein